MRTQYDDTSAALRHLKVGKRDERSKVDETEHRKGKERREGFTVPVAMLRLVAGGASVVLARVDWRRV